MPAENREEHGANPNRQHHDAKAERADGLERPNTGEEDVKLLEHPLERCLQNREDRKRVEVRDHHAAVPRWVASWWTRRASRQLMYVSGTRSIPPSWNGWQRAIRRTASHQPRRAPKRRIASAP